MSNRYYKTLSEVKATGKPYMGLKKGYNGFNEFYGARPLLLTLEQCVQIGFLPPDSVQPDAYFYDKNRGYGPLFDRTGSFDYLEDYRQQSHYMVLPDLKRRLRPTDDQIAQLSPAGYFMRYGTSTWSPFAEYSIYYDARNLPDLWEAWRKEYLRTGGTIIRN